MSLFVTTLILFTMIFVIAAIAVVIASQVLDRTSARGRTPEDAATLALFDDLAVIKDDEVSSISPIARLLEKFDFIHLIKARCEEADLTWSPGRVLAGILLSGIIALSILIRVTWLPFWAALLMTVGVALLPYFYILRMRSNRFAKFEALFPDAMDSLTRALRAGHPFATGMEVLANERTGPVALEIRKTLEEWKLGMTWNQALDNLSRRVPVLDVAIFVAAVKLHIRTGGKLGEVLSRLAESMRESGAIRGEVRGMAAQGKATGTVLTLLPVAIAVMIFIVNPQQMMILFTHPYGKNLIAAAIVCLILAHFIIRKIVEIKT